MAVHRISVIGLGKLGAPLAAVLAYKGFDVVGVDVNERYVAAINRGRAPVDEPRLQQLIDERRGSLTATADVAEAVIGTDATFVIVPTPSGQDGFFSNKHVLAAAREIGDALRQKSGHHTVVVTSTVMPGSTDGVIRETLERTSGRTAGRDLGLCYNPEFIALGSVVNDMLRPDFILIGESDDEAGAALAGVYRRVCENDPPVHRMNLVNAEISKIAVNTFVTTKISYANMLAELCERLPQADVDVVTRAIGSDSRIGGKYLKGAIGYGGPCFPRDNKAFAALCREKQVLSDLALATDRVNDHQVVRLRDAVASRVDRGGRVAILGMAYKPDTAVIDESQGVRLAQALAESGYEVVVHDPFALRSALAILGGQASGFDSPEDCVAGAAALVITTPWPQFTEAVHHLLASGDGPGLVIDPWCLLDLDRIPSDVEVVRMGRAGRGGRTDAARAAAV